ncbi:hypothetical protein Pmani_029942 [Petrolisthes manimaculis]|uniref:Uncharacterized protein n=1 Tax=Petrolisthes manimaculis TaxID=1843537 RepID=A0AAE1NWN6_9EUCA|nr:hypothetical protein Pmani_029942 [Petrolisthes manimaculis]
MGCDVVLAASSLGLTVRWCASPDNILAAALVTKIKCTGKLYPVLLNPKLESAAFNRDLGMTPQAAREEGTPTCALVACESGLVAAVHWKTPGLCVNLCHSLHPVVWAGVLPGHKGSSVIAVADRGGTLSLGAVTSINTAHQSTTTRGRMAAGSSSLQWTTLALPAPPRTFSGQHHCLCFSDGDVVWVGQVSDSGTPGVLPDIKWRRTCIRGVIRILSNSGDGSKVDLFTCDGRKYTRRWDEMKKTRKDLGNREDPSSGKKGSSNTLEGVMLEIQRCSEIMNAEGKEIATLDLYIRQLSLAQRLLGTLQSPIFTTSVRVEHSLERRGSYFAVVHIRRLRDNIDLCGDWWSLVTVLPEAKESTAYLSLKLDEECLKCDKLCLTVPLPDVSHTSNNTSLSGVTLVSYLVLEHPVTATPVCRIFACRTTVDAIHFLTHDRILGAAKNCPQALNSSLKFNKVLSGSNELSGSKQVNKDSKKIPLPPCKVSVLFRANEEVVQVLSSILSPNEPIDTTTTTSTSKDHKVITLFHQEGRIDLSWRMMTDEKDLLSVTLEGTNPSLVLAVRAALECRVSSVVGPNSEPTTLTSAVLWRGHMTQRVLHYEASEASTVTAVAHLHNTTSNLIALLPHL